MESKCTWKIPIHVTKTLRTAAGHLCIEVYFWGAKGAPIRRHSWTLQWQQQLQGSWRTDHPLNKCLLAVHTGASDRSRTR